MPPPINLPNVLGQTPQVDVPDQLFQGKGQALALATLLTFRPELGAQLLGQQNQRRGAIQRAQATNVTLQQRGNIERARVREDRDRVAEQKRQFDLTQAIRQQNADLQKELGNIRGELNKARTREINRGPKPGALESRASGEVLTQFRTDLDALVNPQTDPNTKELGPSFVDNLANVFESDGSEGVEGTIAQTFESLHRNLQIQAAQLLPGDFKSMQRELREAEKRVRTAIAKRIEMIKKGRAAPIAPAQPRGAAAGPAGQFGSILDLIPFFGAGKERQEDRIRRLEEEAAAAREASRTGRF